MSRPRVLVADALDKKGLAILASACQVDHKPGMTPEQLAAAVAPYDALVVRSASRVTRQVIEAGKALKVVARAGVGVDNVDVDAATLKGIVVVNSPGGNTIAAAEHTIAMMMAMARLVPEADRSMRSGKWDRKLIGVQMFKKTLGVVGTGRVGLHVASIARAMGMTLLGYDPYLTPERAKSIPGFTFVPLDELLAKSDFITLHVPKTPQTENLIGEAAFAKMKATARIVNCSRGGVINEAALAAALTSGRIAGAALDVFDEEPLAANSPLRAVSSCKLVLTPHLGASTHEAQQNVAIDVAEQVVEILSGSPPRTAVNLPGLTPSAVERTLPWMTVAEALGQLLSQMFKGPVQELSVMLRGTAARDAEIRLVVAAAIKGLLKRSTSEKEGTAVTFVNAHIVARNRGIHVSETREDAAGLADEIELRGKCPVGPSLVEEHSASGNFDSSGVWIGQMDGFRMQVPATRKMLVHRHVDAPGVIGRLGTCLGKHDINISSMQVGRKAARGEAITVLNIDNAVSQEVAEEMARMPNVRSLLYVELTTSGIPDSPVLAPPEAAKHRPRL